MKKFAMLMLCAAVMASCDNFSGGKKSQLQVENDSLKMELNQRDAELDEMMGTFNEISEGFRQINAERRKTRPRKQEKDSKRHIGSERNQGYEKP